MSLRILAYLISSLLITQMAWAQGDPGQADLKAVGEEIAGKIEQELQNRIPPQNQQPFRIAVLKFNNNQGRYTLSLGDSGFVLQSEIIDALRSKIAVGPLAGKFTVLGAEAVDATIQNGVGQAIDPEGLDDTNIAAARASLANFNLQVGVVGRFDVTSLPAPANQPVKIKATVVLPTENFTVQTQTDPGNVNPLNPSGGDTISRVAVRFYIKSQPNLADSDPNAWTLIPLRKIIDPEVAGAFLLKVPRSSQGKRYKMELENNGTTHVRRQNPNNQLEASRLFSAAAMVDGISVFWKKVTDPSTNVTTFVPDTRSPARQPKRVLTQPGKILVPTPNVVFENRVADGSIQDAPQNRPKGHGKIDILGFQRGNDVADAFIFGSTKNSAGAAVIGSINEIGLISVYIYAEELANDGPVESQNFSAGTAAGEPVPSPLFPVRILNQYNFPYITYHIVYRYDDDNDCPNSEPITDPFVNPNAN